MEIKIESSRLRNTYVKNSRFTLHVTRIAYLNKERCSTLFLRNQEHTWYMFSPSHLLCMDTGQLIGRKLYHVTHEDDNYTLHNKIYVTLGANN